MNEPVNWRKKLDEICAKHDGWKAVYNHTVYWNQHNVQVSIHEPTRVGKQKKEQSNRRSQEAAYQEAAQKMVLRLEKLEQQKMEQQIQKERKKEVKILEEKKQNKLTTAPKQTKDTNNQNDDDDAVEENLQETVSSHEITQQEEELVFDMADDFAKGSKQSATKKKKKKNCLLEQKIQLQPWNLETIEFRYEKRTNLLGTSLVGYSFCLQTENPQIFKRLDGLEREGNVLFSLTCDYTKLCKENYQDYTHLPKFDEKTLAKFVKFNATVETTKEEGIRKSFQSKEGVNLTCFDYCGSFSNLAELPSGTIVSFLVYGYQNE